MSRSANWSLTKDEQLKFIDALTKSLAPLRAKIGISQGELAYLAGVSRQTYSAVESGKKVMSWSTYLSLILFFDYNQATHQMLRTIGAFPDNLVERFNKGRKVMPYSILLSDEKEASELAKMINAIDDQGLHALKTLLLIEYGRCTNSLKNVTVKVGKKNLMID